MILNECNCRIFCQAENTSVICQVSLSPSPTHVVETHLHSSGRSSPASLRQAVRNTGRCVLISAQCTLVHTRVGKEAFGGAVEYITGKWFHNLYTAPAVKQLKCWSSRATGETELTPKQGSHSSKQPELLSHRCHSHKQQARCKKGGGGGARFYVSSATH